MTPLERQRRDRLGILNVELRMETHAKAVVVGAPQLEC